MIVLKSRDVGRNRMHDDNDDESGCQSNSSGLTVV